MQNYFKGSFWILLLSILFYVVFNAVIDFSISKNIIAKSVQKSIIDFDKLVEENNFDNSKRSKNRSADFNWLKLKDGLLVDWSTNQYPQIESCDYNYNESKLVFKPNGIFLIRARKDNGCDFVFFKKLFHVYPYENEFLKNGFTWNKELYDGIQIVKNQTNYPIFNQAKKEIGFLKFDKIKPTQSQSIILLISFFLTFISLIAFTFQTLKFLEIKIALKRLLFYSLIIAFYILFCYLPVFSFLKLTEPFQPNSFAFTRFLPSIVSLLLLQILILGILLFEFANSKHTIFHNRFSALFRWFIIVLSFVGFVAIIPLIVNNTASSIGFYELSEISLVSVLVLFSLVIFIINYIFFINIFIPEHYRFRGLDFGLMVFMLFMAYFLLPLSWQNSLFLVLLLALIFLHTIQKLRGIIAFNIGLALLFSLVISFNLNYLNQDKEQERRKILVQTLALNQDPEVEYLFGLLEKSLYSDSIFINFMTNNWQQTDSISSFLQQNYFQTNKHWNRYDFQITTCDKATNLIVKPSNLEMGCNNFFYNNLISKGFITSNRNLYRMEYGSGQINYLGVIRFNLMQQKAQIITIYIEINSKIKRKGFTKLLSPDGMDPFEKIRDYSLSRYENGYLTETYGDYNYIAQLNNAIKIGSMVFFNLNNYNHLLYRPTAKTYYVLSKPNTALLQNSAPFSNLFILVLLVSILFLVLFNSSFNLWIYPNSFSFRLQLNLIILITLSLVVISIISGYFLKQSNYEKDLKNHLKTAISLQTEFEQKLSKTVEDGKNMNEFLFELSQKFASVFNTDINLYGLNGQLLSSTQPQIFENKLLSKSMNPKAFQLLNEDKNTYINQVEAIGSLEYFSAYMPFHDANGTVVAYLNLPHISHQDQLSKEVSVFIMTLLNVYMLIMVVSVLAILLLSNYFIRPLRLITEKMKRIKIGSKNEHIIWTKKDELGALVTEYNKMVDQIAKSAEVMARAEREIAWQQMAQQVAHEIKNPLTPMKLSVQYLLKALDDGKPGWEIRLKNLSKTLIDQIDTLAEIATAFSDFAKLPVGQMEEFNLAEAIDSVAQIFLDTENVDFEFYQKDDNFPVLADRKNLIRVFNNLIKNAYQSIGFQEKGKIQITIVEEANSWKISIADNGVGIPEAEKGKIFLPNFTTKSSGMGLGLVMVRNILLQHGGRIDFTSKEGEGTTFYIWLNKVVNE